MRQSYFYCLITALLTVGLTLAPINGALAQSSYNISVDTSPNPSTIGQIVTISVTVTDGGNPVSGVSVDIAVDGAGIGSCTTNANGTCSISRSFGDSGSYSISATANGASAETTHIVSEPPTLPPPTATPSNTPIPPTNTPKPTNTIVISNPTQTKTPIPVKTTSVAKSPTNTPIKPTQTPRKRVTATVTPTKTATATNTITPTPTSYLLPSLTPQATLAPSPTNTRQPTTLPTRAQTPTTLPLPTEERESPQVVAILAILFLLAGGGGLIWFFVTSINRKRLL